VFSFKEGWSLPITFDEAVEFLKMGNMTKVNLTKHVQKDTAAYLLGILKAVIHEQMEMGLIEKEEGMYILDAIFDNCPRRGWIE
jgi:hypothetical protein